jgi:hypothetical protein
MYVLASQLFVGNMFHRYLLQSIINCIRRFFTKRPLFDVSILSGGTLNFDFDVENFVSGSYAQF